MGSFTVDLYAMKKLPYNVSSYPRWERIVNLFRAVAHNLNVAVSIVQDEPLIEPFGTSDVCAIHVGEQ